MEVKSSPIPLASSAGPTELAKAALRRLVVGKLEPTPENYARAYRLEAGQSAPGALPDRALPLLDRLLLAAAPQADPTERQRVMQALQDGRWEQAEHAMAAVTDGEAHAVALSSLIERVVRGLDRGGRQWTIGRRRESLQHVLAGTRIDPKRLHSRLSQLVASWESDRAEPDVAFAVRESATPSAPAAAAPPTPIPAANAEAAPAAATGSDPAPSASSAWTAIVGSLADSVRAALPGNEDAELSVALDAEVRAISGDGPTADGAARLAQVCQRADRLFQHRHHLLDQLGGLCLELTDSLSELAEDDSWAKGQVDAMRTMLQDGISARGVRSVSELLRRTRAHQGKLRAERGQARESLKLLMNQMLREIGELGARTGRFQENAGRFAEAIDGAESIESLTSVVGEMLEETRSVHAYVGQTQQRLQSEHGRAAELSARVGSLELELRRLSEEVSTDQLTQIANRRGLMQAFELARARVEREGESLSIGLLDVDNFKRLNDELGHTVGDEALRSLAAAVGKSLRPADLVARYGGEEFVVLLPATPTSDGEQILTRLQRSLSVGLFMHERKTVFVTFSAGVTAYRAGETIEAALERADEALYEAKRTGKNRTCVA